MSFFNPAWIEILSESNFEVHDPVGMGGYCIFLELSYLRAPLGMSFRFFYEYQTLSTNYF